MSLPLRAQPSFQRNYYQWEDAGSASSDDEPLLPKDTSQQKRKTYINNALGQSVNYSASQSITSRAIQGNLLDASGTRQYDPVRDPVVAGLRNAARLLAAEKNRVFDAKKMADFQVVRKQAMASGDYIEARRSLLSLYEFSPEKKASMYKGMRRAGTIYTGRIVVPAFIGLLPTAFQWINHGLDPVTSRNLYAAYFGTVVTCAVASGVASAFMLLHLVPYHDTAYRWGPTMAAELGTPAFADIATSLDKCRTECSEKVDQIDREILARTQAGEDQSALELEAADRLQEVQDKMTDSLQTYMVRCQLNDVYFQGMSSLSFIQTVKQYANLTATWAGFVTHDSRIAAAIQTVSTIAQLLASFYVAPGSKVREQETMMNLKITTATSEAKIRTIFRTPLSTRAKMLGTYFEAHAMEVEVDLCKTLKLHPVKEWRRYSVLDERLHEVPEVERFTSLQADRIASMSEDEQADLENLQDLLADAMKKADDQQEDHLSEQLSRLLQIPVEAYRKYLMPGSRLAKLKPLSDIEDNELDKLRQKFNRSYNSLTYEKRVEVDGQIETLKTLREDVRYVQNGQFTRLSDAMMHMSFARDCMTVTENHHIFKRSPEFWTAFYAEGNRRSKTPDEAVSAYGSAMWKNFQLLLAGANGSLMISALLNLIAAQLRTTDDNYRQPLWEKIMSTALVMLILAINIRAAYSIVNTKTRPLTTRDRVQIACGPSSSIADGTYVNWKLKFRAKMRDDAAAGKGPTSVPGQIRQGFMAGFYGMAAVVKEALSARAACKEMELTKEKVARLDDLIKRMRSTGALNEDGTIAATGNPRITSVLVEGWREELRMFPDAKPAYRTTPPSRHITGLVNSRNKRKSGFSIV